MPWEKYGMEVAGEAQNGEKALEFLNGNQVDLLFVDLDMPVMNGIDLMKKVRELYPDILFVVLTFYERFSFVQQALRLGALDYISKLQMESLNCDQMLERISRRLEDRIRQRAKEGAHTFLNAAKKETEERHSSEAEEEQWKQLGKEWNEQYWLYSRETYEDLCLRTKESAIPLQRAEQIFFPLVSEIEKKLFPVEHDAPPFRGLDELINWISAFRQTVYAKGLRESDLTKIPVCLIKAVSYMEEHLDTPLQVDGIAQMVNLSRSYFSVNFKRYTGMTFKEFTRSLRIRAAKRMLESGMLVSYVAPAVGYEDVNYFIKVFSEATGRTPGEYRKLNRSS